MVIRNTASLDLGNIRIGLDNDHLLIAECCANHMGDINVCKKMFESAKACGANAVKLQKRNNKSQYTSTAYNKIYNSEQSFGKTYGEHREFLEFNEIQYVELREHAKKLDLLFGVTSFDLESLRLVQRLNVDFVKIASGDSVNHPLLIETLKTGIPAIISTGATSIQEVDMIYEISKDSKNFGLLQCTSSYPAKYSELNLNTIKTYQDRYPNAVIGFSGHENGIAMGVAAFALGARIIEKHFTLDRTLKGTDQVFSLSPSGLSKLSRDLERCKEALGDGIKVVYKNEFNPMQKQRKSIVAAKVIKKGEVIGMEHINYKVPNLGLKPYQSELLLGKKASHDIMTDEYITLEDIEK